MKHFRRIICWAIFLLAVLQLALLVLSWLFAAACPDMSLRSPLTAPGLRWFFGSFVSFTASPVLVWLIVWSFAVSALHSSGLLREIVVRCHIGTHSLSTEEASQVSVRSRFAAIITLGVFCLQIGVLLLLTLPRHAVLLSVTGTLFPGSFAAGIIPALAFILTVCSLVYGVLSFRFRTVYQLCNALCSPLHSFPALLLFYVLTRQLLATVGYIFHF